MLASLIAVAQRRPEDNHRREAVARLLKRARVEALLRQIAEPASARSRPDFALGRSANPLGF